MRVRSLARRATRAFLRFATRPTEIERAPDLRARTAHMSRPRSRHTHHSHTSRRRSAGGRRSRRGDPSHWSYQSGWQDRDQLGGQSGVTTSRYRSLPDPMAAHSTESPIRMSPVPVQAIPRDRPKKDIEPRARMRREHDRGVDSGLGPDLERIHGDLGHAARRQDIVRRFECQRFRSVTGLGRRRRWARLRGRRSRRTDRCARNRRPLAGRLCAGEDGDGQANGDERQGQRATDDACRDGTRVTVQLPTQALPHRADQFPLPGSNSSAETIMFPLLLQQPPATSTRPSSRSVAVWVLRPSVISAAAVQDPSDGW